MLTALLGALVQVCSGICLSAASLILMHWLLPGTNRSRSSWLQRFLRGSYAVYATVLGWLRPHAFQFIGLDLLTPIPRILFSLAASMGFVYTTFGLLGLSVPTWLLAMSFVHGLYIGWAWGEILRPEAFHFGMRVE